MPAVTSSRCGSRSCRARRATAGGGRPSRVGRGRLAAVLAVDAPATLADGDATSLQNCAGEDRSRRRKLLRTRRDYRQPSRLFEDSLAQAPGVVAPIVADPAAPRGSGALNLGPCADNRSARGPDRQDARPFLAFPVSRWFLVLDEGRRLPRSACECSQTVDRWGTFDVHVSAEREGAVLVNFGMSVRRHARSNVCVPAA